VQANGSKIWRKRLNVAYGNLSGGTPTENDVALGTGQVDLPAILKAAREVGIENFYIEDESPIYYQQVLESIELN